MAGIQLTAKQIQPLIDKVRPVVDAWTEGMLKRNQERSTRLHRDLKEATLRPTDEEREASIQYIFEEQQKLHKKWWFSPRYTRKQAEIDYAIALSREQTERIQIARTRYVSEHIESDTITPVLNYLEALARTCDPEAIILLSDNETFQIKKALELCNEKSRDTGHEGSVP